MANREKLESSVSEALAREFIDQQAATFHEAFGVASSFNPTMSRYQSKDVFDLEDTLKRFQGQRPGQADFDFDLLKCTWDDVLHELERAQDAASVSGDRGKKFYRRAWRALGTAGTVVAPGFAAIPDELCVLHGGLAVVFSLARHRSDARQKILRAFEDIPNVITMAYGKAESIPRNRPGSNRLYALIGELQQTLLGTLPVLIDRLNPGTFLDRAKSPFRTFQIDDLLTTVHNRSEAVRVCAEEMMDNIIVSSHRTLQTNHETTRDIHMIAQQTEEEIVELRGKIEEILKYQKAFQITLDATSGKNSLLSFLTEYLQETGEQEKLLKEPSPVHEPEMGVTLVTPRQLLGLMNVHHLGALNDEQHIIKRGNSMEKDAISHASTMFETSQVKRLLNSPESGIVLVNGCADRSQHTKISPITHTCATLAHALRRVPKDHVVLSFFCGQHSTSNDDLIGPQGVMRSLATFLVLILVQNSYISDSSPIRLPNFQGDMSALSFRDICQMFYHLTDLVPRETKLYCILDGISYCERAAWKEDYDLMMECFSSIIKKRVPVFKLLLTSPTISRGLPDLLPHQKVSLRNVRARGAGSTGAYLQ